MIFPNSSTKQGAGQGGWVLHQTLLGRLLHSVERGACLVSNVVWPSKTGQAPYSTLLLTLALLTGASAQDGTEFFEMRIRPILAQECYECHSEATKAKGGLLLDSRSGWQKGSDSGPVIVPGDPDGSILLQTIRHEIEDLEMPKNGAQLDSAVIEDFHKWIAIGAPDPRDAPPTTDELESDTNWDAISKRRAQWWSFLPIERPTGDSVDHFIRGRLTEENLTPADKAEPRNLLRRLFYNLVGLPPTPVDTAAFLDAYETDPDKATTELVDRLLDEPGFGERWARHWMDWTRYADSHGSEGDPDIPHAWRHRDYLIRALNADIPYDQLVLEHFAGDLLDEPRIDAELGINESAIGPAHLRMVFHGFAPTDALDERVRFTDDQINTVTKAFMGLTVSCARCHDHKFDAISQADFYALFGIFTSTLPATIAIDAPGVLEKNREALEELKPKIREALVDYWLSSVDDAGVVAPERSAPRPDIVYRWDLSDPVEAAKWTMVGEGIAHTDAGEFNVAAEGDSMIDRVLPAGVYSNRISSKHRGILASPPYDLDGEYDFYLHVIGEGSSARYAVQNYPRRGTVYPVTDLKEGKWRWQKYDRIDYWNGDSIHIELATAGDAPILGAPKPRSWFGIREAVLVKKGTPFPTKTTEVKNFDLSEVIRDWKGGKIGDASALALNSALRTGTLPNNLAKAPLALRSLITEYRSLESSIPTPTRAPGVIERPGIDQALYVRGDHKQPADPVPRRFIEAIDETPYATKGTGRLEFAHDLLREDNPFTARVAVNRIWGQLFGNGLVATMDNFGRLGQKPSHPELLDFLADRFRNDQNWSIKSLIRELVLTDTWQQSSDASPEATERDPGNRLLSHYLLRRLDAEAIRDTILTVSGQLDDTLFGAPVSGNTKRRSIYLKVKRNSLNPLLTTFDFPTPASTVGRRNATNVPAQSLTMLNDPFIKELAGAMAKSLPNGDEEQLIERLFETALTRMPSEAEIANAESFLRTVQSEHSAIWEQLTNIDTKITQSRKALDELVTPVREKILAARSGGGSITPPADLKPLARWNFDSDTSDQIGGLDAELHGTARIEDGALVLDGNGYAATPAIPKSLTEKTLEVVVQLATLDQKGGGALTVQNMAGILFDSIVYAERKPKRWLTGSNNHARTLDFTAPDETEATDRPAHLAITYEKDGTIRCFRDGEAWGKPIRKADPQTFAADDTQVLFGLRHGKGTGANRMLSGRILEAALYDRALMPDEISAAASGDRTFVSDRDIENTLSQQQKAQKAELENTIATLESRAASFHKNDTALPVEQRRWQDLAHAIFNLKEFIYLR